jgi:bacillithiol biosynthesis cysteine-adding enzyme BshC
VPERTPRVVDYSSCRQPLSPLFLDYVAGRPSALRALGTDGWDLPTIVAAGARASSLTRDPAALTEALVRQQEARGVARAASPRELAQREAVAVVSGQQACLFGGPLFVLWKALGVLEVARRLREESGRPSVPVFWVASDDHDFAEVRSVTVLDMGGQLRTLRYTPRREPSGQPAWDIVLDSTISGLVDELARLLPPGLHRDEALALVAEAYRPGETLAGAFATLLSALLPDLVVLDAADRALKALAAPVFAREVREGSPSSRLALEDGRALLAAGYHQQVPVRAGFLNLFLLSDGVRRALAFSDDSIEVRGTDRRMSVEETLELLDAEPERFSPNALLRPLTQDAILPTAAYLGGPAEIAYQAQIASAYRHFGIPRPVISPRPGVTLLEPAVARALEAEELDLSDLAGEPEAVLARWARKTYPEVETAFAATRGALEREMSGVERTLAALDPTLRAATEAARGRALHQVAGLHEKAIRVLKKRDQDRAERLRRTRDALWPGGTFQERGLGLVGLIARHGTALLSELRERIDPFARGHQVIPL